MRANMSFSYNMNYMTSWNYGYTMHPEIDVSGNDTKRREQCSQKSITMEKPSHSCKEVKDEPSRESSETDTSEQKSIKEDGEIIERSLEEILQGRNPIIFCNDQSKLRGFRMEWEQISETGPPHNKTFTWSLKMGDMTAMGSSGSKKGAKNKAAEEMVKKIDKLPKPKSRFNNFFPRGRGHFPPNFRLPRGRGVFLPNGFPRFPSFAGPQPPMFRCDFPPQWEHPPTKRQKMSEPEESSPNALPRQPPAVNNARVSETINPISKLYEYCKKRKLPEPIFQTISENVIERTKTLQGFTLKKTEFTIQVDVVEKVFTGKGMTKKQAKHSAAEAAWADISACPVNI